MKFLNFFTYIRGIFYGFCVVFSLNASLARPAGVFAQVFSSADGVLFVVGYLAGAVYGDPESILKILIKVFDTRGGCL